MKKTNNNSYVSNLFAATGKAAKVYGVDAAELRKHYKNLNTAPASLKPALVLCYKIMRNYAAAQKAVAVEPATAG